MNQWGIDSDLDLLSWLTCVSLEGCTSVHNVTTYMSSTRPLSICLLMHVYIVYIIICHPTGICYIVYNYLNYSLFLRAYSEAQLFNINYDEESKVSLPILTEDF